jgi:hypothetical protein
MEVRRPQRSCALKENKAKGNSDSEISEESEPDDEKDQDFSLNKPRKPRKKKPKSARKCRRKCNQMMIKEAPSWSQVETAHRQFVREEESSDDGRCGEQHQQQRTEFNYERIPEHTKKKRIVIRPWNPGWYQVLH